MADNLDPRGDDVSKTHDPARKQYSATETRQGFLGLPVLKVLLYALLLAIIVWAAAELWGEGADTDAPSPTVGGTETQPDSSGATTPGQGTVDNTPPAGTTQQPAPTDQDPTPQSGTGGESQQTTPDGTQNTAPSGTEGTTPGDTQPPPQTPAPGGTQTPGGTQN
ncbi:MAG: hypothetical protein QHC90_11550 [Shinella sp.]|nr:hypothetical protein [Shinella sp.]